jgi:hypothetical protein
VNENPWAYQDEMAEILSEEWDIQVSKPTVCRLLKEHRISHKKGQRIGDNQRQMLRNAWIAMAADVTAEQLVFLDETLFKAQSCWRSMAYAPIGDPARWHDDIRRGDTWSVLPAYTVDGYLPCTGVRKGYFNAEHFLQWVTNCLLPLCNPFPSPCSILCLDNVSLHLDTRIREVVEAKGCLLKFLPPYSPDYNPIEGDYEAVRRQIEEYAYGEDN